MFLNLFVRFEGVIAPDMSETGFALHGSAIPAEQNSILKQQCESPGPVTMTALNHFLDEQRIDTSFSSLVDLCRRHHVPITVVSNNFDYSVRRMLDAAGVPAINVVAYRPVFDGDRLRPEFPDRNPDCGECSCCPRNIMLNSTPDGTSIAFVGAGSFDGCPASFADIVFARGELQTRCQQKNISYREFRTLNDVTVELEQLLLKRRIPRRREAEHLRRAVFSAE